MQINKFSLEKQQMWRCDVWENGLWCSYDVGDQAQMLFVVLSLTSNLKQFQIWLMYAVLTSYIY